MKKIFTIFALFTILGVSVPAFAAPPPPNYRGGHVHAGPRPDMRRLPRHHGGHLRPHNSFMIYTGYPRHDYFYSHRLGGYPYCGCPYCMTHRPFNSAGFYISF